MLRIEKNIPQWKLLYDSPISYCHIFCPYKNSLAMHQNDNYCGKLNRKRRNNWPKTKTQKEIMWTRRDAALLLWLLQEDCAVCVLFLEMSQWRGLNISNNCQVAMLATLPGRWDLVVAFDGISMPFWSCCFSFKYLEFSIPFILFLSSYISIPFFGAIFGRFWWLTNFSDWSWGASVETIVHPVSNKTWLASHNKKRENKKR